MAKDNSAMNPRSPMAHIGEGSRTEYAELLERLRAMVGDNSSEANIYKQASDAIKATPRNKRVMLRFWVSEARLCNSILDGMRRL